MKNSHMSLSLIPPVYGSAVIEEENETALPESSDDIPERAEPEAELKSAPTNDFSEEACGGILMGSAATEEGDAGDDRAMNSMMTSVERAFVRVP